MPLLKSKEKLGHDNLLTVERLRVEAAFRHLEVEPSVLGNSLFFEGKSGYIIHVMLSHEAAALFKVKTTALLGQATHNAAEVKDFFINFPITGGVEVDISEDRAVRLSTEASFSGQIDTASVIAGVVQIHNVTTTILSTLQEQFFLVPIAEQINSTTGSEH